MEAHQLRVITEKDELDAKIGKLAIFIENTVTFGGLPEAERMRLYAQYRAMVEYSTILGERIEAF